jgi:hypothetical protein
MINNQHERVRSLAYCICCGAPKEAGLLICWPCHRAEKRENGGAYSAATESKIEKVEIGLAMLANALADLVERDNAALEAARDGFDHRDRT